MPTKQEFCEHCGSSPVCQVCGRNELPPLDLADPKCPTCGEYDRMVWYEPVEEVRSVTFSAAGIRADYTGEHTDADSDGGYLFCRACCSSVGTDGILIGWDEDPIF